MMLPLRTLILAFGILSLGAPAQASVITYTLSATITGGATAPLQGIGVGLGDHITASFIVDDSISPTGTATYSFFGNSIVGGSVSAGGMQWEIGGAGDNYAVVWNDEAIGFDTIFDGFWLQAPISGPSPNGLAPWYIGFALFSYQQNVNDTFSQSTLPSSLQLANFNSYAGGTIAFGIDPLVGTFSLAVDAVAVTQSASIPEPGTLILVFSSLLLLGPLRSKAA
jgi:hypothetical protein